MNQTAFFLNAYDISKKTFTMSDENEANNPYQAPTLSDEPLARKDADGPKAKLHPVHWLFPIFGYAY